MTNYTKTTNFATKDTLPSGNANKIVKGTEIDTEFNNIATAVATKADTAGPTFTGTVTIPTVDLNGGAIDGTTVGASTAAAITGTTIVANTSINIAGDGATVTGIKDEDDMSSNSATKLATQQSIKAYVDSQVTAQDLDFQADSGGALSIDLDSETLTFTGGTGVDTSGSGNAVTFAIDSTVATLTGTQTLTNKTLTSPTLNTPTIGTSFTIGSATITEAELEILDGATVTTAELNVLDGITSTTAELNILDGVTSTAAELNILDGVTATTAELNYVDGVTSAIQTQIDAKAPLASPTFTGTVNAAALTVDTTTLVVDATNNRVGIGTSSPDSVLEANITTSGSGANNNTAGSSIGIGSSGTTQPILGMRWTGASHVGISGSAFSTQIVNDTVNSNAFEMYTTGASPLVFGTGAAERMRIDSSGNLLVGDTSSSFPTNVRAFKVFEASIAIGHNTSNTSGDSYVRFGYSTNTIGSITQNGTTAVLYNTSSDQRLKDNIVDAPSASDDIDAIQVRSFDWKVDGSHQKYGMVAQELQSVAPEAVSAPEDPEEMMGVDYSKLVPMLVKEIQSLRARVAQLENN